jgi:hypothetical protein
LQSFGVTAVELLPVHHHVDERPLVDRGLKNYWGYNTVAFFAPNARYHASSSPFDLGPRSLGVFGLHEGTDAEARAEAWQTAAGAASDNAEAR